VPGWSRPTSSRVNTSIKSVPPGQTAYLNAAEHDGDLSRGEFLGTAEQFKQLDTNGDGLFNRADAQYVDRNVGKNYTNLNDVLGTNDDLIAATTRQYDLLRARVDQT
jgi:hypothetical protein